MKLIAREGVIAKRLASPKEAKSSAQGQWGRGLEGTSGTGQFILHGLEGMKAKPLSKTGKRPRMPRWLWDHSLGVYLTVFNYPDTQKS